MTKQAPRAATAALSAAAALLLTTLLATPGARADVRVSPRRTVEKPCRVETHNRVGWEAVECVSSRDDPERCERLLARYEYDRACSTRKTRGRYVRQVWWRSKGEDRPALPDAVRTILTDGDAPDPAPRPFAPPPPAAPAIPPDNAPPSPPAPTPEKKG